MKRLADWYLKLLSLLTSNGSFDKVIAEEIVRDKPKIGGGGINVTLRALRNLHQMVQEPKEGEGMKNEASLRRILWAIYRDACVVHKSPKTFRDALSGWISFMGIDDEEVFVLASIDQSTFILTQEGLIETKWCYKKPRVLWGKVPKNFHFF